MLSEPALGVEHNLKLFRATALVTLFACIRVAGEFIVQVAAGAFYGAGAEMDAFLAAYTLPQYMVAILTGALPVILVPVLVSKLQEPAGYATSGFVSSLINQIAVVLGVITLLGLVAAEPLIQLTAPGLSEERLSLATNLARITWAAVFTTGMAAVLAATYQAGSRFTWPAVVQIIGVVVSLGTLAWLAPHLGILAMAWATVTGATAQVLLLLPRALPSGALHLSLALHSMEIWHVWHLLWPLLVSGLFVRASTVVDRFVASSLAEGTISHLAYASRSMIVVGFLLAVGISTVVFPRMALAVTRQDLHELARIVSSGTRMAWLVSAPAVGLCVVFAFPLVGLLYQRGEFNAGDTAAVAELTQYYALALGAMALGAITGRVFYAMKRTRLLAVMGMLEMAAYVVYTPLLASLFGAAGIAVAYALYFTLSLVWHLPMIWFRLGRLGSPSAALPFLRIGLAALACGVVASLAARAADNPWLQLVLGGGLGLGTYVLLLYALGSTEVRSIGRTIGHMVVPVRLA